MKKITLVLFLLLLSVSCSRKNSELIISKSNVTEDKVEKKSQQIDDVDKKPLIEITKTDSLKIYVRSDGAPGMYLDTDGVLKGFYIDLEKAIMKEMGQKYELISYSDVGPVVQKIKSGIAHSALATPLLPDYKTFLNISNQYEILKYVIFLPSKLDLIVPENKENTIKTLSGKRVGVQTRGHIYQLLRDYKNIELVEYPTTTVAMEALSKGEIDAVPEVKRIGKYYSKKNNWAVKPAGSPIFSLNIGTGFSKALDPSVVDRYNVALKSLIDSGYVDTLYKSYFGE
ncbi:MAG: hypothetical protein B6229_01885 [Spirochaetaceae bacterium 4572_7]|nr:MAG: hypothetical protein B6229_01885 [Spirochaetaceae bacterium 4572_7]